MGESLRKKRQANLVREALDHVRNNHFHSFVGASHVVETKRVYGIIMPFCPFWTLNFERP